MKVEYKKGFVVFLDVLGFKNMVKNEKSKIERYLDIVYREIEKLKNIDIKKDINNIVISDSIILSVDTKTSCKENIKIFSHLCLFVALVQEALALENIWLRGAISFGDIFFDEKRKQIIGQGYINAYLLEEKQAIYPRVIIDNRIINFLEQNSSKELIKSVNALKRINWKGNILYNWDTKSDVRMFYDNKSSPYAFTKDIPLFIDYLDNEVVLSKEMGEDENVRN